MNLWIFYINEWLRRTLFLQKNVPGCFDYLPFKDSFSLFIFCWKSGKVNTMSLCLRTVGSPGNQEVTWGFLRSRRDIVKQNKTQYSINSWFSFGHSGPTQHCSLVESINFKADYFLDKLSSVAWTLFPSKKILIPTKGISQEKSGSDAEFIYYI